MDIARPVITLRRLWRGDLALGDAFWNWAVFGGIVVNLLSLFAFLVLLTTGHTVAAMIAGHVVPAPYNLLIAVGVWRSAGRFRGHPRWAWLARLVTTIGAVVLTIL